MRQQRGQSAIRAVAPMHRGSRMIIRYGTGHYARWILKFVCDSIVDRGSAGRVHVADPGSLHRSGFASETEHAIQTAMPGEVDENVDAVGANQIWRELTSLR